MALKRAEKERAIRLLTAWYNEAEQIVNADQEGESFLLDKKQAEVVRRLGRTRHGARGAALTLCLSQTLYPELDVRNHKAELANGFSARGVDENATVPFLAGKGLAHSVQSHWLTRTLANDTPYWPTTILKTVPKTAGPDLISIANYIYENRNDARKEEATGVLLLIELIKERNQGKTPITRPKGLSIDQVMDLLHNHFNTHYRKNAPRLPQLAIYAICQCMMTTVERYKAFVLEPLQKMKSADRKSGTVGDVVLLKDGRPIEAVEIKYNIPIDKYIVSEAILKVQSQAVERYFILSTVPPKEEDVDSIEKARRSFLKSNGCEIIVNGVYDTIKYYLRLLKSTNEFINNYADLLEKDTDLNYEHKVSWNACCEKLS